MVECSRDRCRMLQPCSASSTSFALSFQAWNRDCGPEIIPSDLNNLPVKTILSVCTRSKNWLNQATPCTHHRKCHNSHFNFYSPKLRPSRYTIFDPVAPVSRISCSLRFNRTILKIGLFDVIWVGPTSHCTWKWCGCGCGYTFHESKL